MKTFKFLLLILLYVCTLIFTLAMQNISIRNPDLRLLVNASTLLMALVSGTLFWLIYKSGNRSNDTKSEIDMLDTKLSYDDNVESGKVSLPNMQGHIPHDNCFISDTQTGFYKGSAPNNTSDSDSHYGFGMNTYFDNYSAFTKRSDSDTPSGFDKDSYLCFARKINLTRRESEIGLLIMNGYSNLQIAETLFIAETTVKKHVSHIYEKAGVSGRKALKEMVKAEKEIETT